MRQKLNLITLGVNDLEKSLEFFEKGLNWEKSVSSTDNLVLFPLGGIVLALYPRKLLVFQELPYLIMLNQNWK
jgi:catechol 2,3-dioxygenase-like lactoylglutathione lyase family enzyme